MNKIKQSGADGVFLGGLIDENGAQVIKDKVKVGSGRTTASSCTCLTASTQQTIDESGVENTRGAFFSVAGVPVEEFTGSAEEFITAFEETLGGGPVARMRSTALRLRRSSWMPSPLRTTAAATSSPSCSRPRSRAASLATSRSTRTATRLSRERRGRRLHDLQWCGAARDRDGSLSAGGERRGCELGITR